MAWVEPGVLNLDLSQGRRRTTVCTSRRTRRASSRASIGGNVANNSGGPHCLLYGVTSAHVLAVEVVLPDGEVVMLGGLEPGPAGLRPAGRVRRQRGDDGHRHARSPCD